MSEVEIIFDFSQVKKVGDNFSLLWDDKVVLVPADKCEVISSQRSILVPGILLLEAAGKGGIK